MISKFYLSLKTKQKNGLIMTNCFNLYITVVKDTLNIVMMDSHFEQTVCIKSKTKKKVFSLSTMFQGTIPLQQSM